MLRQASTHWEQSIGTDVSSFTISRKKQAKNMAMKVKKSHGFRPIVRRGHDD